MATLEKNQTAIFTEDKANKQIHVEKTVEANLQSTWDAWSQSEKLDQWWAPKPWKAVTKSMDFREGGQWLYSMRGPNGEVHWSKEAYKNIEPLKSFEAVDSFCDENGIDTSDFAKSLWKVSFSTAENKTKQKSTSISPLIKLKIMIK